MIHPIPSGTRDVLPEETREVRAITDTLRGVFERHEYGEVYTPALEYESVLARADMAEARPAYRVFDETGAVLVLRSDMTVPIARVVATRYGSSEPPLRFCYFAHCYRGVRPQRGQPRELLHMLDPERKPPLFPVRFEQRRKPERNRPSRDSRCASRGRRLRQPISGCRQFATLSCAKRHCAGLPFAVARSCPRPRYQWLNDSRTNRVDLALPPALASPAVLPLM